MLLSTAYVQFLMHPYGENYTLFVLVTHHMATFILTSKLCPSTHPEMYNENSGIVEMTDSSRILSVTGYKK